MLRKIIVLFLLLTAFLFLLSACSVNKEAAAVTATSTPNPSPSPASQPSASSASPMPSPAPLPSALPSPSDDNEGGPHLPPALPTEIRNEDGTITPLHISNDDPCYFSTYENPIKTSVRMDFNGDGQEETLTLDVSTDFTDAEEERYNCPMKIILKIADSETIFESYFNDGIMLYITDFNVDDPYKDIYVFESSTDFSGSIHIYKYDGQNIRKSTAFRIETASFTYDGLGMIYFDTFNFDLYDLPEEADWHEIIAAYDYINDTVTTYKRLD